MRGRIQQLREIERILGYLEGELRCRHAMLDEALHNVSLKTGHPFDIWLEELSHGINAQSTDVNNEEFVDFNSMWRQALGFLGNNTLLNSKDIIKLLDVGKALGYLDIESQQMNLNLEREQLHSHILELDKDLNARMKNVIVLSFLGGLMVVISLL